MVQVHKIRKFKSIKHGNLSLVELKCQPSIQIKTINKMATLVSEDHYKFHHVGHSSDVTNGDIGGTTDDVTAC